VLLVQLCVSIGVDDDDAGRCGVKQPNGGGGGGGSAS